MTDIIVPVYNVEKHLRRCIDSILAQTCTDFKLILVDDGSTDSSGKICDEYASSNDNIIVIHKSNGGPSSARNAGLDWVFAHSERKWITFIDSDDWVNPHYLESLLNAALKCRTSVSICEYASVNRKEYAPQPLAIDSQILSAESLYCIRNTDFITPWGKLYAKELWNNIRYPEEKIHEDEFVTYKILFAIGNIAYISAPLYYYFLNPEGITRSEWTPARLAVFEAKAEQIQFMQEHSYNEAFRHAVWSYAGNICRQLSQMDQNKYPDEAVRLKKALRKHIIRYKKCGLFSVKQKKEIHRVAYPVEMRVIDKLSAVKRRAYGAYIQLKYKPKIMNSERTVNYILKSKCSVSRFGDGEYEMITGVSNIRFQQSSRELSDALSNVLKNPPDHLLLCVWDIFGMMTEYNSKTKRFWKKWNKKNKTGFIILLHECCGSKYLFGNARFTRPYKGHPNEKNAKKMFPLIKKLWDNRDVLIVEGAQTRLGVNNDLLDNAATVQRILAPAVNAFDKYSEILTATEEAAGDRLILIALGPTATVLACDLCRHGFWAIDIGHIDIEYEWFLRKATDKIPIPGKYTNEAKGGNIVEECEEPEYKKQIIKIIE